MEKLREFYWFFFLHRIGSIMPQSVFAFILFVSFFTVSVSCANDLHTLLKQILKSTLANQFVGQALSGKTCSKESFTLQFLIIQKTAFVRLENNICLTKQTGLVNDGVVNTVLAQMEFVQNNRVYPLLLPWTL